MDGILVIDKPYGPTSHDICQYFKRQLNAKKVGHAGTLDPLATGVLILLIDGATKHQAFFMGKEKEYEFTFVNKPLKTMSVSAGDTKVFIVRTND